MPIDLHLHTQASDGTLTPQALLTAAKEAGLTAVAITDHDATTSLAEAGRIAAGLGLTFIPGVEVSASYTPDLSLHILGYGIDPQNQELCEILRQNQKAWAQSEEDSIAALEKINIKIDREQYNYWLTHPERGGWPLLNTMIAMGLVRNYKEYFEKYFGWGQPAYITITFASPPAVISAIKAAGGVPVLAHPGVYQEGATKLISRPAFLETLIAWGIEGLEAIAGYHSPEETAFLLSCCERYNLLVTGGSDYHGEFAGRKLGTPVVDERYLSPLLSAIDRAKQHKK